MTIKGELVKFCDWTSCHGIPHVGRTRGNPIVATMWGLLTLSSACFVVYYTAQLVDKYQSRPVNVQSEIKFEQLPFPAVTICNLNPIRKSQVSKVPALENLLKACDLPATKRKPGEEKKQPTDFCETQRGSFRSILPKGKA